MTDETATGVAELKAVFIDLLHPATRNPHDTRRTDDAGSNAMANRDRQTSGPQPAGGKNPVAGDHDTARARAGGADSLPAAADRGHEGQGPASGTHHAADTGDRHGPGRAGGRRGEELATTDDRQSEYGAGMEESPRSDTDADDGNWPPRDWDANGNAKRHGQVEQGRGPGGYEDRSRELRDYGPGPEGATGEAWRTYEHHGDGKPDADADGNAKPGAGKRK
jgi:hypothetical protein